MKKKVGKSETIIRLDFDVNSREFIEIFEISPDGSQVRTRRGWIPSHEDGVITQRPQVSPDFTTTKRIEEAIRFENEILKEKKFKKTASYMAAKLYPIKEWLACQPEEKA